MKGYMKNGTYFRDDNLGHRVWNLGDRDTLLAVDNYGNGPRGLTAEEYFELSITIVKPWRKRICLAQEAMDKDVANYLRSKETKVINI